MTMLVDSFRFAPPAPPPVPGSTRLLPNGTVVTETTGQHQYIANGTAVSETTT